jgi:DNA-binding response OmpR family regulator
MGIVVLLDGDALRARLINDNLATVGHVVLWANQSWDGLLLIHRVRPNLIIVDSGLSGYTELLKLVRAMRGLERAPLLLLASRQPAQYDVQKFALAGWIHKHFDAEDLVQQVQRTLQPPAVPLP